METLLASPTASASNWYTFLPITVPASFLFLPSPRTRTHTHTHSMYILYRSCSGGGGCSVSSALWSTVTELTPQCSPQTSRLPVAISMSVCLLPEHRTELHVNIGCISCAISQLIMSSHRPALAAFGAQAISVMSNNSRERQYSLSSGAVHVW